MTLEIDFNNPNILRGYLEQALPQMQLSDARVTVGKEGGLAYLLFKSDDWQGLPREPRMHTLNEMNAFKAYFDAVEGYVNAASEHAKGFGFGLVTVDGHQVLSQNPTRDSPVYQSGIGGVSIESAEKFEKFLHMVKEGSGNLEGRYAQLTESAKSLQDSRR